MNNILCLLGKGNALVYSIDFIITSFPEIELIVVPSKSDPDNDNWQFSIKKYCKFKNVRLCLLEEIYCLKDAVIISIQYDVLLKPNLFNTKKLYNIHFSLLPKYKGLYPSIWPILNNEVETGVTLHFIDFGIDTGKIIDQTKFEITITDTSRQVYYKCLLTAFELFKKNIQNLLNDNIRFQEQSSFNSSYFSKDSIDFDKTKFNFRLTAYQIHNQIRAFQFREFQMPMLFDKKIFKTEILESRSFGKPGDIIEQNKEYTIINTIDFNLKFFHDYYDIFFETCKNGDSTLFHDVITYIKDYEVTNDRGWSGLMIAAYYENLEIVKKLYQLGANINASNYKGTTVLMYAKSAAENSGNFEVLNFLIENGADYNVRDFYGLTVLDYIKKENNNVLLEYFESKIK
jgi:methionyl-tRNA formyltransferase